MKALTAALVVAATSVLLAPNASADSADDQFLSRIMLISDPSLTQAIAINPQLVTSTGRKICSMIEENYGYEAITGLVQDRLHLFGDNPSFISGLVGAYAVANYCPEHNSDSPFANF